MNNYKVSVIVPVYNTESFVDAALSSVMNQTLREIEIIIVDDCSTDRSLQVVEEAAARDCRIQVYAQPHRGLSDTRNYGLQKAQGEFVYFMDSDDLIEADTLQVCYDKCMEEKLDFALFDGTAFNENGDDLSHFGYCRKGYIASGMYTGLHLLNVLLDNGIYRSSVCLVFIRRERLAEWGLSFYSGIIHEDELFTALLYLQAQRVAHVNRTFFKRRVRPDSIMTRAYGEVNMKAYFTVATQLLHFGKGKNGAIRHTTDQLVELMLKAAVYRAKELEVGERIRIAVTVIRHYPDYVRFKNIFVLLFPYSATLKASIHKKSPLTSHGFHCRTETSKLPI